MESYNHWSNKLANQTMEDFSSSEEAKLWLKIHSIAKREVMKGFVDRYRLSLQSKKVEDKAIELYNSITDDSINEWNKRLDKYFNEENKKQFNALDLDKLEQDLCLIQHFKWGGDQNNSLDKYFVSHYVKAIRSYNELKQKLASEALNVVENYVLASWYNHWTSIVIEHFFKQHKKVLPTIGQVKSIDFIIDGIPFDLKVTYLPKWYQDKIKSHLTSLGLPNSEIASLRKFAKKAKIKYGKLPANDQHYQIRKLLENHHRNLFNEAIAELEKIRDAKIRYAKQNAKDLAIKLYEKQGASRFGSENRIYLILIDRNDMDNSWEMKRDFIRLKTEIDNYLNNFDISNLNEMKLTFTYGGRQYSTHADVLFIIK
ncbi:MAG: hypothetical protein IKX31_06545 [Muribaculaceae bacterium]|nr:hypothetical protein [Muribaculaceae bacterium]